MSSSAVLGQFLWHELLTADPKAGAGFYSKVFGWSAQPWEGAGEYTMLTHAHGPLGGVRVVGKDSLASEAGPNWLTYVGVPDIEAALATAKTHGAKVIHALTDIAADGGRYAVIADPQGAAIGLYEPSSNMSGGNTAPVGGPVAWHELTAEDPLAALQFYKDLFGWEVVATHEMGDLGTYYLFGIGATQMGGVYIRAKHIPPGWPRWLVYLHTPGVVEAVAAAKAAGGQLINGPMEVPGGGWTAQLIDSHGVALALHGPKEAAVAAPKAAPKVKPKAKAALKAKTKPEAAPAPVEPTPTVAVKANAKTKVKAKAKAKTKTKTKTKAKAKVAVKPKAKSKAATKTAPKRKAKPKAKAKPKSAAPKPKPAPKGRDLKGKKDKDKKKDKKKKDKKKARRGK